MSEVKRRSGWRPRFSLWAMLVLVTVVAVPLGYVAQRRSWNLRRKAAMETLLAKGISLECSYSRARPPLVWGFVNWNSLMLDDINPPVSHATDEFDHGSGGVPSHDAPESLALLTLFPELESIELHGWETLTDEHLQFLRRMPSLASFTLVDAPQVRGEFFEAIASTRLLEFLEFRNCTALDGSHLKCLENLDLLTMLVVLNCPLLNDESLLGVNLPPQIVNLNLQGNFGDKTLARWLGQCRLEQFYIDGPITEKTTAALRSQTKVKSLAICNAPLVDEDFTFLKQCEQLEYLTLESMPIHGALLKQLPHPEKLHGLSFGYTLFSDEHLTELASFAKVGEVNLAFTPISGEGFAALHGRNPCRSFRLWGTRFSKAGKAALAQAVDSQKQKFIYLPSNWRVADLALLNHAPQVQSECCISALAAFEPNVTVRPGATYSPIPSSKSVPLDHCPQELMAPVMRLLKAAARDEEWMWKKIKGTDAELPPEYEGNREEAAHGE